MDFTEPKNMDTCLYTESVYCQQLLEEVDHESKTTSFSDSSSLYAYSSQYDGMQA